MHEEAPKAGNKAMERDGANIPEAVSRLSITPTREDPLWRSYYEEKDGIVWSNQPGGVPPIRDYVIKAMLDEIATLEDFPETLL